MAKNNRGKYCIFAISAVLALFLTACGSTSSKEGIVEETTARYRSNNYAAANYSYDAAAAVDEVYSGSEEVGGAGTSDDTGDLENGTTLSEDAAAAENGRKLIKEASLDVET